MQAQQIHLSSSTPFSTAFGVPVLARALDTRAPLPLLRSAAYPETGVAALVLLPLSLVLGAVMTPAGCCGGGGAAVGSAGVLSLADSWPCRYLSLCRVLSGRHV